MPLIPIIKTTAPLANLPNAVLDRERRPTVDNSGVAAAIGKLGSIKNPELPNSLAAPSEALSGVGRAIAQAGGVLGALATARRDAETDLHVSRADTAMQVAEGEIGAYQEAHANEPELWEANAKQQWDAKRGALLNAPNLTPAAREKITQRLDRYSSLSLSGTSKDTAKQMFGLNAKAARETSELAIRSRDLPRLQGILAEAGPGGKKYLHDYEVEHLTDRFAEVGKQKDREAKADDVRQTESDAIKQAVGFGEKAGINFVRERKDLDEQTRQRIEANVRQEARVRQSEQIDALARGISSGRIGTQEEIDEEALDNPHITSEVVAAAQKQVRQGQREKDLEEQADPEKRNKNFADLFVRISDFDRSKFASDQEAQVAAFNLRVETAQKIGSNDDGFLQKMLWERANGVAPGIKQGEETKDLTNQGIAALFPANSGPMAWKLEKPVYATDKDGKPVLDSNGKPKPVLDSNLNPKTETFADPQKKLAALSAISEMKQRMNEWAAANPKDANDSQKVREQLLKVRPDSVKRAGVAPVLQGLLKPQANADTVRGFAPVDLAPKLPPGLRTHAGDFVDAARQYNLNPRALAAISALETGGGTSKAFREKLNAMGVSDASGPVAMATVRDSIFHMAKTLANERGPYARAKTLDEIGAIYAPPGAGNDLHGTNAGWSEGVKAWMARL